MAAVDFTIPGEPVPFARAGAQGKRRFTPKKQSGAMGSIKLFASNAMAKSRLKPFSGPVRMTLIASYIAPASWSAKKRASTKFRASRPDIDNLTKLVADAINGIVFVDDSQVVELYASKTYAERAEIVVQVAEIAA